MDGKYKKLAIHINCNLPIRKITIFALPGMLAQLVQSIALTGRGSLVRVQYIPQNND